MSGIKKSITIRQRLEAKMLILPNGCWKWTGINTLQSKRLHPNNLVYGRIKFGGKTQTVHRVSWTVYRGPIPIGKKVLHDCDFPLCFNPDHLFIGTQKDNMRDCSLKARIARGEKHPSSKLTDRIVRKMRELYIPRHSKRGTRALAVRFGIGKTLVGQVIRKERWKHIR